MQAAQHPIQQLQQQQAAARRLATAPGDPNSDARQAKKRRPTDRSLPVFGATSSILPTPTPLSADLLESNRSLAELVDSYNELQNLERRLDRTITRKRVDLAEQLQSTNRPFILRRKLRLTLRTECEGQTWQGGDGSAARWTLKVDGEVVSTAAASDEHRLRFSEVVPRMLVESEGPSIGRVEWARSSDPVDGVSLTRDGTENVPVRVHLMLEQSPERWKLPPALSLLFDMRTATRAEVTVAIWAYASKHRLIDQTGGRTMRLDEPLKRVFPGANMINFGQLQDFLSRILIKADPLRFEYTVVVDRPSEPVTYEMPIEVEDPAKAAVTSAIASATRINTVTTDEQIATNALSIRQARTRRDFFAAFADDPVTFLQTWTASQANDLGTILGDHSIMDDLRRSETYHTPWLVDSIRMHDSRRIVQGAVQQKAR